jgi:hypothetical protein
MRAASPTGRNLKGCAVDVGESDMSRLMLKIRTLENVPGFLPS